MQKGPLALIPKAILLCVVLVLLPIGAFAADEEKATDFVWVAVRTAINGIGQPALEYCGTVENRVFAGLLTTAVPTGFVKMTNVFWIENGRIIRLSESGANGAPFGYSNTMYFRAETVLRMIPLDEEFVKKAVASPEAAKPAGE